MRASVAVLIPYAGEGSTRLGLTVASAIKARPSQVIVFGDGCHVSGAEMPGVQVFDGPRMGAAATLNRARRKVRPDITHVMWLSTGDTIHEDRLSKQPPFDKGEFCTSVIVDKHGDERVLPTGPDWERSMLKDGRFGMTGAIIPIWIWDTIQGANCEGLTSSIDWDLAVRVRASAGWVWRQDCLAWSCEYPGGITATTDDRTKAANWRRVRELARRVQEGQRCA